MKDSQKVARKRIPAWSLWCVLGLLLAACTEAAAPPGPVQAAPAPDFLAVATPDAGWHLRIERIVELDAEVWILAQLWREPGPAAQVIQEAKAVTPVALPAKARRVFVAGKTWAWSSKEPYEFVPSLAPVIQKAGAGRVLYTAPAK
jgi:hypothetical protein